MVDLRVYIEERSIPVPFAGCWMWLRSCGSHGYGQATLPGVARVTTAHRVSYTAFKGNIPAGLLVQHKCDQHWGVNPDHLELGTDQTNSADKIRKGRDGREKKIGQIPTNRKLTDAQIAEIRTAHGNERELAARFFVSQTQVNRIKRGLLYKNVAPDLRPPRFHIGDVVSWTSKNYGATHFKTGTIVDVVAPNTVPSRKPTEGKSIVVRPRESYVVAVGKHHYWPRASEIKLVSRRGVS